MYFEVTAVPYSIHCSFRIVRAAVLRCLRAITILCNQTGVRNTMERGHSQYTRSSPIVGCRRYLPLAVVRLQADVIIA